MNDSSPSPELPLESEVINFHTNTDQTEDRVSAIRIKEKGDKLGEGKFSSDVSQVKAAVLDEEGNESPLHTFVLKRFKYNPGWDYSKGKPGPVSLDNFLLLKEKGLKTWMTYRLSDDGESVLMSNGNMDGKTFLATNVTPNTNMSEVALSLEKVGLKKIEDFDFLLEKLFSEAKRAEKEKIYIHTDAYGFFVEDKSVNDRISILDFVIGDMDNIESNNETQSQLYKLNISRAFEALKIFLGKYTDPSIAFEYLSKTNEYIRKNYPND